MYMSENMIACNLTFEEINKLADKVENGKLSKVKIKNGDCEIVIEKERASRNADDSASVDGYGCRNVSCFSVGFAGAARSGKGNKRKHS